MGGELDIVFGECNANAPGVIKTAHLQGRAFALETSNSFRYNGKGVLHQHVPINGLPRKTAYNDLFPAFLTQKELYRVGL